MEEKGHDEGNIERGKEERKWKVKQREEMKRKTVSEGKRKEVER